ncbi:MAG TPA: histidinol-phosphate transaminase [Chryseosolibacter sp.]|nr:histidinol-phosphate transaminase [Chryseosolibacter sp.]
MKAANEGEFNVASMMRNNIREMKPYSSARDEFNGGAEIFLDANENSYAAHFNRYPDPLQLDLKKQISKLKNIAVENIFLGNGSDEAIDLVIRAFCEPNCDNIIVNEPTYGMYAVCANVNAVKVKSVSLTRKFDVDVMNVKNAIDVHTKIIFLCSPNNPTGNLLDRDKIISLLNEFSGLVVVDEAYIDFAEPTSFISQLDRYPNLVVLQTFSKAWGLAGLRLGMAFAAEEIIAVLNKIKFPYNINMLTMEYVQSAIEKQSSIRSWVDSILRERKRLEQRLRSIPCVINVYPSDANFLLVKFEGAKTVYRSLADTGVIVRDRSLVPLCDNCLRITVGTPSENDRLINVLSLL